MMIVGPHHQRACIPFRTERYVYFCAQDIIWTRHEKKNWSRVSYFPVEWIDEPIGRLSRRNFQSAAGINVPGRGRIFPGELTRDTRQRRLLSGPESSQTHRQQPTTEQDRKSV